MTTTTTTAPAPTTATTSSSSSTAPAVTDASSQQLAGDYDTFLQLLTTQLQNQDPLDPLDTSQFTQQLVEFASVEQQIDSNTNLQTLIGLQQTSEATSAMQYLGANVTVNGSSAALSAGSPATWEFTAPSAATGTVTITSSTGQTAYTGPVSLAAGSQSFSWNGQGSNGVVWAAGNYTMSITATGTTGQSVAITTQVQGTVTAVNTAQNPPTVTVGGQIYAISAIQSINSSTGAATTSSINSLNSSINTLNSSISTFNQLF
jgi:flagellar basal-body rod modification protein FlgD